MSAATSYSADSAGIQCRDDVMDTIVDTLHLPVKWHTNLIFYGFIAAWRVAMFAISHWEEEHGY